MAQKIGFNTKRCSDEEFRALYETYGGQEAARILRCTISAVFKRKKNLEKHSPPIVAPTNQQDAIEYPHRAELKITNGVVIVGSDFHIWPGTESTALRAFKKLCKDLKPAAVILNGDVLDFPQISRHPSIMWENTPFPVDELEAAQDHLNDIAKACGRAHKIWPLGNHDARFETFIAKNAPQMRGVHGVHLADHFGLWQKAWSCWINDDVVVKHRFKGGIHATHNNTLWAGKTMVTGHLHSQRVTPLTDYNGTRYGIDTGCVANPNHAAFVGYTEDNPKNWISGFVVLKFHNGRLMYPELVSVWDKNSVQFRGEILKV